MADARALTRPRVVLGVALVLVLLAVLLSPQVVEQRGALSSYSTAPGGARALHDAAERLGWRVARRTTPLAGPLDTAAVYAVLEGAEAPTAREVHALLEAVRAGAGLLFVVRPGDPLTDSLGFSRSATGVPVVRRDGRFCPDSLNGRGLITWFDDDAHSWWLDTIPSAPQRTFVTVRDTKLRTPPGRDRVRAPRDGSASVLDSIPRAASAGFAFGAGRVVAVADADLLRNDVARVCEWGAGVAALRAVAWLGAGRGRPLVFSEFHHGYGVHGNPLKASARALVVTAPGRAALAVAAAGLVLLAAVGRRAIAPVGAARIERRSPLEHVGALARAYEQVGATRTVARRLVRGLRRRHAVGRRTDDAGFLDAVAARRPALATDARRLHAALADDARPSRDDLRALGDAAARLDAHLTPLRQADA